MDANVSHLIYSFFYKIKLWCNYVLYHKYTQSLNPTIIITIIRVNN